MLRIGLTGHAIAVLEEDIICSFWNRKQCRKKKQYQQEKILLTDAVFSLWQDPCNTYCVCREPITYFRKWEFTDYREAKWVDYLLKKTTLTHLVVMGSAPCLWELLPQYAGKMKSLKFFLWEKQFTQELEALLEDLFEEYGLATDVHFVGDNCGFGRLPEFGTTACTVLDFSGEEKVSVWSAASGSVWIDPDSMEEKRRRLESGNGRVCYLSLQKEWQNPQKTGKTLS
ncbi:MAG: hypothetical protein J6C84_08015 [Lachnospiraceae bacterium]|nr:hypothetical protein [Lachnospiraceae bacterium]